MVRSSFADRDASLKAKRDVHRRMLITVTKARCEMNSMKNKNQNPDVQYA
jgi:hypothetical protein